MQKKRIIKGIVLIIIGFIVYFGCSQYSNAETSYIDTYRSSVFNDNNVYGGIKLQYVDYFNYENEDTESMFFCNRLGYPPILVNRADGYQTFGTPDISRVTTTDKEDRINPQIAYALSIGILPMNFPEGTQDSWDYLQTLIWDANLDSEGADGILASDARTSAEIRPQTQIEVRRFRKVYEEILAKTVVAGQPLFKIEDKQASLFVDQNDGTYIYGPFQLKVNSKDASQDAINYLIDEIMQEGDFEYIDYDDNDFEKSEAYIENFYKLHKSIDDNFIKYKMSNPDKKILKYKVNPNSKDDGSYTTIIVDRFGEPIDFPTVTAGSNDSEENNFFIKFFPYNNGAIINLGDGEEEAELFSLKVKYGHYVKYKEHIQECVLYTKGVYGFLPSTGNDHLISSNSVLGYWPNNEKEMYWMRVDGITGRFIDWASYLKALYQPEQLAIYNNETENFVSGEKFTRDNRETGEKKYALNNYYTDLRCVGYSTNENDKKGARIEIPFGFAAESDVYISPAISAYKRDYALPLTQKMDLSYFYGVVRRKATVTYSCGKETRDYHEGSVDPATNVETQGWWGDWSSDGTWTSGSVTVYKYEYEELTPDVIAANADKITTGSTSQRGIDESNKPSKPSDSDDTRYGTLTMSTPNWQIDTIYGGTADGETATEGFIYKTGTHGWDYDRDFDSYSERLILNEALDGERDEFSYVSGDVTSAKDTEYVIRIPRNFEDPPTIDGAAESEDWYAAQDAYNEVKSNMQSFISIEPNSSDTFKYGEYSKDEKAMLPHLKIAEAFGGNVWRDSINVKGIAENSMDGIYNPGDKNGVGAEDPYRAVKVDLYECDIDYKEPQRKLTIGNSDVHEGIYLTSTFTDKNGNYRFYGKIDENVPLINPLKKYFVKFVYNGQIYAQTLYNVAYDTEYGEYIDRTSKGIDEYRTQFNKRFENIYSDSNNYTYAGQRYAGCNGTEKQSYVHTGRAYGLKHAVKESIDGVANDPSSDPLLDTFEEQYNFFIYKNTHADFITATEDYQFKHAPGNKLTMSIDEGSGEIVTSNIDDYWEHKPHEFIDYDYSGLSPSVAEYLKDCMIEASVPYSPELTVYGNNIGKTDLHQKFPKQATFNLKDMNRTYMDHYRKWKYTWTHITVDADDPRTEWETIVPPEIAKYVEGKTFDDGTTITIYVYEGEEYYHIEGPDGQAIGKNVKVASLNDNLKIEFDGSETKVAGKPDFNLDEPEPEPGEPGPVTPGRPKKDLWGFQWEEMSVDEVHVIDETYIPDGEDYINLYNKKFDLRHCWSFGVYEREYNELKLDKDLYKATMVVNGKKEVYSYSKKLKNQDEGPYNILQGLHVISVNRPLNGGDSYTREIRKSDYLYDEDVAYGSGKYSKNIKAYLTYKIQVTNLGPYTVRVNEIADYYDADNLEFDGVRDSDGNLIVQGGRYQIATHTENIDGQINKDKYTYASNMMDKAGHDPNKEYIGIYNYSAYKRRDDGTLETNPDNAHESFVIANDDPKDNEGKNYNLDTIYIRGNGAEGIPVVCIQDGTEVVTNQLLPNQVATLFVTFKVKNNSVDSHIKTFKNQIRLDNITRDFAESIHTVGKNNFAEINSYASYYTAQMPEDAGDVPKEYARPYGEGKIVYGHKQALYLDIDGKIADVDPNPETDPNICIAGVVDVYSNPGSFSDRDVEVVKEGENRELQFKDFSFRKITKTRAGIDDYPRLDMHSEQSADEESLLAYEPDTDKAPTIRLILDDDEIRKISGCVFDDNRTVDSDGSPIGNGENEGDDTPVNGVTVQLVELIQDVDYDGTFTGQYIGEKVWDECTYSGLYTGDYQLREYGTDEHDLSGVNYYSGIGLVKYILNSTDDLKVIHTEDEQIQELVSLAVDDGKYCFAGLPSGDFIIRFLYGDTERTVMTKTELSSLKDNDNENDRAIRETKAVNELPGISEGLNAKSYNGQDYKSTVYQRKLNNDSSIASQVNQDDISYKMKEHQEVEGYTDPMTQDYKTTQDYYDGMLRTKEELYRNDVIYYEQPINNDSKDSRTSDNNIENSPRSDIHNAYESMWRYDRVAVEGKQGSTNNKLGLSDANDLYGYRQRGIDYAKGYAVNAETGSQEPDRTLLNYRAEVLSSFERLTSQEWKDGDNYPKNYIAQKDMIDELIENTYMVAQSGIISMNHEYEGIDDNDPNILNGNEDNLTDLHMVSGDQPNHVNHAEGIDLGLVERPRSQVKLTKNVANLEIKLADGQTLFNANTSMKNLKYKDHEEHKIDYKEENVGPILEYVRVKLHTQTNPELIQAEIDDEIMNGATINATYHLQVENVGEIDYQDRYFYYYGKKLDDTEPVRTRVVRVVDYVPNDVSYDASKQNDDAHWDVYNGKDLIVSGIRENSNDNSATINIASNQSFKNENAITNNGYIIPIPNGAENPGSEFYDKVNRDYVTRTFSEEVRTYNTIVVTKDLDNRLLPTLYTQQNESAEGQNIDKTTLILTTSITSSGNSEDLTYNNLAEVIETANPYGRRMQYSISGNQEMANQDINDGGGDRSTQDHHAYSSSKITQPKEIDADSAQEIQILPPTGSPEYRNRVLAIITTAIATIIVLVGAIIIKKKVYEK